jgi:glucose/mannose-6-phosphate isomerase
MAAQNTDTPTPLDEKFKLVFDTIKCYPLQLKSSWEEVGAMFLPEDYKSVNSVVLCGMGGSALGGRMIDSLISERLRIPFEIFTEYHLPNYVNEKTLVIVSSYSGTTEETINCTFEALNKSAKIFGLTTGRQLGEILKENNIPSFIIDEKYNPSKQPRMSIGYASGTILALFTKLSFIQVQKEEIDDAIFTMNNLLTDFQEGDIEERNLAKRYASKIKNRFPVLISSEHLVGTSHTLKNRFNEDAKTFSINFDLPELNHHLMEGLQNPKKLRDLLLFIFFESKLYSDPIQKRYPLTEDVVKQNGYDYEVYKLSSDKKMSQLFELLIFGSLVAYYLTKIYNIDPTTIPWVDYFKSKLSKDK